MTPALVHDNPLIPDWCPPGVWPLLQEEVILMHNKCSRKSAEDLAEQFGLPFDKIRGLTRPSVQKHYGLDLAETQREMAETSFVIARKASRILNDKLDDPNVVAKMSARDAAIIKKQNEDSGLNLNNGVVGGGKTEVDFKMLLQMISTPLPKPGETI